MTTLSAVENHEICKLRWPSGVRFFDTSDGKYLMILADLEVYQNPNVRRDITSVFYCDETGMPTPADMVADHEFPAGTTHEEALSELGYTVQVEKKG